MGAMDNLGKIFANKGKTEDTGARYGSQDNDEAHRLEIAADQAGVSVIEYVAQIAATAAALRRDPAPKTEE